MEPDTFMELLLMAAGQFGPPPALPASLNGSPIREATKRRADFLGLVDKLIEADARQVQQLMPQAPTDQQGHALAIRLGTTGELAYWTALFLEDVPDLPTRTNVAL